MKLTQPQREMLDRLRAERDLFHRLSDEPVRVGGNDLRVAMSLERKGLVKIGVGGSGVAYLAPWWWTAQLTKAGRAAR